MKKIVKKTVFWRCSVCGEDYERKSDAKKCEKLSIEQKKFKMGDRVTNSKEPRVCMVKDKRYKFKGKICKIFGPESPDEDYWCRWLGGSPDKHVFRYRVAYKCPICGKRKSAEYFGPELEKVK